MISLPPGFDPSILISDYITIASPVAIIIVCIGAFFLVNKIIKGL